MKKMHNFSLLNADYDLCSLKVHSFLRANLKCKRENWIFDCKTNKTSGMELVAFTLKYVCLHVNITFSHIES